MYFDVMYQCQKRGRGTVELTIPLDYFKDISLIFIKECMTGSKMEIAIQQEYDKLPYGGIRKPSSLTPLELLLAFLIALCVLGTCFNLCVGHRQGLANIPCLSTLIRMLLFITCLRNT